MARGRKTAARRRSRRRSSFLAQIGADHLVIDPPADVLRTRRAALAPPGVVLALRSQRAVTVDPAVLLEQSGQPGALLGQVAGILLVALGVADVHRRVRDVPVAANDVTATGAEPFGKNRLDPVHDLELELLALLLRRARRQVQGHHAQVAESRLDVAPLFVEFRASRVRCAPRRARAGCRSPRRNTLSWCSRRENMSGSRQGGRRRRQAGAPAPWFPGCKGRRRPGRQTSRRIPCWRPSAGRWR